MKELVRWIVQDPDRAMLRSWIVMTLIVIVLILNIWHVATLVPGG